MIGKINIEKIIKDATKHVFLYNSETQTVEDNLNELLDNTEDNTVFYVGINHFVISYFRNNLETDWNISGIFQLGFPYSFPGAGVIDETTASIIKYSENHPGLRIREALKNEVWSLFVFTKECPEKIIIGFNNSNSCKLAYKGDDSSETLVFCVQEESQLGRPVYNQSYLISKGMSRCNPNVDYFKVIQKSLEKGHAVERNVDFETFRDIDFEVFEIPTDSFYLDYLQFLYRYKKSITDLFGFPNEEEQVVYLKDEVDFIEDRNEIKKGDIMVSYLSLNISERKYDIRITIAEKDKSKAKCQYVIRSKRLSPYYILSYFESDFLKEFILSHWKSDFEDIAKTVEEHNGQEDELSFYKLAYFFNYDHNNDDDWKDIDIHELPIIINHNIDTEYFRKKYEWEKQEKSSIQKHLEKKNHSTFYNQDAKEIILRDMKELRTCFTSGTYKATIILAGSVLEAFLIDWLSEISNRNYFEEDYMVFDKYRNKYRRADLKDYISSIAELKKPLWFDAAQKATEIRKKRNLVHAKLYINDSDITRETCTEVINYLEYVINTRWGTN